MAPKVVSIPLAFGRRDRIDPRHAPFGVLKTAVNARLRKDGRIGVRGAYRPLEMTTPAGTLTVWDLFEFQGRLCALGDDRISPIAARDLYEYTGQSGEAWRPTDRFGGRIAINPIANLREVGGIGQPEGGVGSYAIAAGMGHVCLVYQQLDSGRLYALIVDAATNQTVHYEDLVGAGGPMAAGGHALARAVFRFGAFYVAAALTGRGDVTIARYVVGQSSRFEAFATVAGTWSEIAALDLGVFTNTYHTWSEPVDDRIAVAFRRAGASTVEARSYRISDATLEASGSFTEASANQISIASGWGALAVLVTTPTAAILRRATIAGGTLSFSGGSVVVAAGASSAFVTWQPRMAADPDTFATVANVGADMQIRHYTTALALVSTQTIYGARATGRPLSATIWSDAIEPRALLVPAIVAPKLAESLEQATNALFFVTPDVAHVVFRDYVSALGAAAPSTGLALDVFTRQVAWPSLRDPGVDSLGMPTITLADVGDRMSRARQGVTFGRLRYFAGGAPAVYDGRFIGELGFGEAPGIVSLTGGSSGSTQPAVITAATQLRHQFVLAGGPYRLFIVIDDGTPETDPIVLSPPIASPLDPQLHWTSVWQIAAKINADPDVSPHLVASVWRNRLRLTTTATGPNVSIAVVDGEKSLHKRLGFAIDEPSYGTGRLYPGGTYHYIVHWETVLADGSVMLSPPSAGGGLGEKLTAAATITLEQGQDQVSIEATTPHTVRVALGDALYGAHVSVVASRTEWDSVLGAPVSIYRRVVVVPARVGIANYGKTVTLVDSVPDAEMATHEALYTQGAESAYGGRLEINAPGPCRFITATESRLMLGGLLRDNLIQLSFEAAPNEAFGFNNLGVFFAAVPEAVRAVRALDAARFVFTDNKIFAIYGDGPDDVGGGVIAAPVEVPSPSGLRNARSVAASSDGLWFQLDDDKLYRIPRGGGAPEWVGIDVEDHLRAHPVIVGAAEHRRDGALVFATEDNTPVARDRRTENWFTDEAPGFGGAKAIAAWQDAVAYADAGGVLVQATAPAHDTWPGGGGPSPITYRVGLHAIHPFGLGGHGQIYDLMITGEHLGGGGPASVEVLASLDGGAQSSLGAFAIEQLGEFARKFAVPHVPTGRIEIEIVVSPPDEAGEGVVLNQIDLLCEAEGGLRELPPAEMA